MDSIKYWIVRLGKLYYACGVSRFSEGFSDACSYEMTTEEMVAWPFRHVEVAARIAEAIGGTIVEKKGELEGFIGHAEQNLDYLESGGAPGKKEAAWLRPKKSRVNRNGRRIYSS